LDANGLAVAEAGGGLTLAFYTDWPTSFWITALSGMVFFSRSFPLSDYVGD